MKNFKKVLALVLAVVMLLSFATVASAVTSDYYKDAADIDYNEAVDVLGSIGVLNGFPDDTFRPDATITRAQAAKIIAMFDNGSTDINKLYTAANPFADCVDHWAESYIAYGVKTGIIAGIGGDKFAPEANVTGVQFLKMVLVVLGYDAKVEGLEGKNWDVNTLALAKQVGLTATLGNKFDYSADLSRQEAAVIMLDALRADVVEYGTKLGVNYDRVAEEIDKWNKADEAEQFAGVNINGVFYMTVAGAVKTGEQLMEQWNLVEGKWSDAFYRPYTTWTVTTTGKTLKYMYPVAAEYTTATNYCNLLVDLGVAKTDYRTTRSIEYSNNGRDISTFEVSHNIADDCVAKLRTLGGQGTLTQVFYMGGKTYRVTEIETWLGRVTDVTDSRTYRDGHLVNESLIDLTVVENSGIQEDFYDEVVADKYSVGEYVLVTRSYRVYGQVDPTLKSKNSYADGLQTIVEAKAETAALNGVSEWQTKVGDTWTPDALHFYLGKVDYNYPVTTEVDTDKYAKPLRKAYSFLYDTYGNVIGIVNSYTSKDVVVIDWMYMIANAGNAVLKANIVGLDAKITEAATVAKLEGKPAEWWIDEQGDYANPAGANWWGVEYGINWSDRYEKLYFSSTNADGEYTLNAANGATYDGVALLANKAYLYNWDGINATATNVTLTDDTQILVHEVDGSYTAVTGKDVGTIYADHAEVLLDGSGEFAAIIYLYGDVYRQSSKTVGFVAVDYTNRPDTEAVGVYDLCPVTVYFDGEAKTIYVTNADYDAYLVANGDGFYEFRFTDKVGDQIYCEIVSRPAAANTEYSYVALDGNTLKVTSGAGAESFKVAADVVIYDVYAGVVTKVDGLTGGNLRLGFNAAGVVTTIYCIVSK